MLIRPPCFASGKSALLAAMVLLPLSPIYAQPAHVTGQPMLHLNTSDLDASLALYRDLLGMEMFSPAPSFRDGANLGGAPGTKLKIAQLRAPGGDFRMELIEWTGAKLNPQHLRIQDPGQIMLSLDVHDFPGKLEGVKRLGLKVMSKNGEVETTGNQPALMILDPTGYLVELNDIDHAKNRAADAWDGPITAVRFYITVADLAKTVAFYNNVFGFGMPEPAAAQPAPTRIKTQFDQPAFTTFRLVRNGTFPGIKFPITFQEFGGVERHAAHHGVMDPGGAILPLTVTDLPAAVAAVQANGGMIGLGTTSETLPPDARAMWVRDPNGVLLRLSAPAPARGAAQ
jgi:catechol 2,3-dioxygenase-like lactoylglutathione lyase family enzyme